MERILRVENDQWIAHAVFRKVGERWVCWEAATVLYWMATTPIENIKRFLNGSAAQKGWRYCWLSARPSGFDVDIVHRKERHDDERSSDRVHEKRPRGDDRDRDEPAGGEG